MGGRVSGGVNGKKERESRPGRDNLGGDNNTHGEKDGGTINEWYQFKDANDTVEVAVESRDNYGNKPHYVLSLINIKLAVLIMINTTSEDSLYSIPIHISKLSP